MALLDKAKSAVKSDDDKKSDAGDKPKHKKKHPSAPVPADQPAGDDAGDSDGGSDAVQPEAGGEGAPDGGAPDADASQDPQAGGGEGDQEQGQVQGDDQNNQQPQAQQGTPPVKNPQAPGAGDDTSGGEDTPDDQDQATGGDPNAAAPSPAGDPGAMGGPQGADMQQVPMSPALKEEYENLDRQLVENLFQKGAAQHLVPGLAVQGPQKIKAVVTMSVLLARTIFTQAKAPPALALPFARDVAAHIMQIGEQVKQIQYSDQEATAIFGAVYEGMLRAMGVKKSHFQAAQGHVTRAQFAKHAQAYTAAHQHAKGAIDAQKNMPHADHVDEMGPQGGPAQAAGPQGPQGAPPAAQGGMLAQGAAQQPQQPQPDAGGDQEQDNG